MSENRSLKLSEEETERLIAPIFNVIEGKEEEASMLPFCFDQIDKDLKLSSLGIINGLLDALIPGSRLVVKLKKDETSEVHIRRPDEDGKYTI